MEDHEQGHTSGKSNYKDVLTTVTVMLMLKIALATVILFVANSEANANSSETKDLFCNWVADAAIAVAQNRNNGILEYDLINKVLGNNKNYQEHIVIIPLIDRMYGSSNEVTPYEHALIEYDLCDLLSVNRFE